MIRGIVFDFDGVIANSEPLHLRAFQDVLAETGLTLSGPDYYARYLGFDDAGVFRAVGEDRGQAFAPDTIATLVSRKAERLETLEREQTLLFPGAAETVRRLAESFPLAIASGALGHEIRRTLDRERLTASFRAIVAAEDTAASKPAPDPYLAAVARLGTAIGRRLDAHECVAVEDSRWGLASARAAGLHTVAITHSYPASELPGADMIIDHLAALTDRLVVSLGEERP